MGPMKNDGTANLRTRDVLKNSPVPDAMSSKGESTADRANTGTRSVIKTGASKAKDSGDGFPAIAGVIQAGNGRSA